jgi:trigger factor
VRLGLVLAEVGEKADIKVADDEVTQALAARVRQYPGQEREVWEYYTKKNRRRSPRFRGSALRGEGGRSRPHAGEGDRAAGLEEALLADEGDDAPSKEAAPAA